VAAVAATATYSLDPNFLAHSALVKNDVALALLLVATCAWTWRVGRRAGVAEVIGLGLLCGACVVTKATGVLLAPIVTALLLLRAVEREPWTVLGRARATRRRRLAAALAIAVTSAALAFGVIWATYGFDPGRDPAQAVDLESLHEWVAYKTHRAEHGGERPTEGDLARWQPDAATRLVGWADRAGLFPRPWLAGVLYTRAWSTGDDTFLLGRFSYTGWWYYFPLAVLFKTPLATLAGLALAAALLARSLSRLPDTTFAQRWLAACLVVPVLVVSLTLLRANLNLGVRYVLGVVPFLYLGVGWAVARAWAWRRPGVRALILAGALGLCLESLAAHPNQLAFFNAACGGSRGGLRLLGDSNLDWGQDLPALARWQAEHRGLPLYLSYFGTADPVAHGVDSASLPGGYPFGPPPRMPSERPAVVAISATLLQGARATGPMQLLYRHLRRREPLTVLNGSLYLFRVEDFDLARLAAEAEVLGDRQATGGRAP
jgi:hypothetical protein